MAERRAQTLGRLLRQARLKRKLSVRGLAARVEVTPMYISDIELDRRVPGQRVLARLATELELDLERLRTYGHDVEGGSLGRQLQAARAERKLSLRQLARQLGVSSGYVSDWEVGRRVPAEPVLAALAGALGLDLDRLMIAAGRPGDDAERYLRSHPTAALLLRKLAQAGLDEAGLEQLLAEVDRLAGQAAG